MSVRSGQSVTVEFTTSSFSTGAATNATGTPAGILVLNGVDNAAGVTVTNIDTGRYKAQVTLPTLAVGDVVELVVSATVGGVAGKAVVWRDTKDILLDASGDVTFNNTTVGTVTTLTNLPAIPANWLTAAGIAAGALDGKGDWLLASGYTAPDNADIATLLSRIPGTVQPQTGDAYAAVSALGTPQQAGLAVTLPAIPANWLTAAGIAAGALDGKGDWLLASGYTAPDNADIATLLSRIPGTVQPQTGDAYARIGPAGANLTSVALAAAGLDAVAVETGLNARQALSLIAAALFGLLSGAATATVVIKAANDGATTRLTATVDVDGDRTAVALNPPA